VRDATQFVAGCLLLAAAACQRVDEEPAERRNRDHETPASLTGTSQDYGIAIKSVWLKTAGALVDARFEIQNQGRSIVSVQATDSTAGSEALLSFEEFRDGVWEREKPATGEPARFVDLWPGATLYARTTIPHGARWARVVVRATGLVGLKDGVTASSAMAVTSDAFEISESR
jgi:hypothetical protein